MRHRDEDHEIFYRLHLQTFQTTPFASDVALRYLQFLAHFRESETDENTELSRVLGEWLSFTCATCVVLQLRTESNSTADGEIDTKGVDNCATYRDPTQRPDTFYTRYLHQTFEQNPCSKLL